MRGVCRICGCTEDHACTNPEHGNCWWVDDSHELCSHCAIAMIASDPRTRHPKYMSDEKNEDAECCTCIWFCETDEGEMCGHPCHIEDTICCNSACADYETE